MNITGELLDVAKEAVTVASDLVRTTLPGAVTAKGDRDMATEVDFAVELALREHLADRTPTIGFLGEERGAPPGAHTDLLWTLDPIDGTANFLHGLPLCAVSLGLVDRRARQPVLGVIDLPFLDVRYSAALGRGAYRGERPIRTSTTTRLAEAVVAVGDYAVGEQAADHNRLRLAMTAELAPSVQRVRMLGSAAIDLAWVAEGRLDCSLMFSNKVWDTAAGVVLAREAGAAVRDRDGSEHSLDSAATIAAAPGLIEELNDLVGRVERLFGPRPA
jgi:myo-inositol-1(or 4)-monophosphatase